MIPHAKFGAPRCCGCLRGIVRGSHADIVCNECGTVVRTVLIANLEKALCEMELSLDFASEMCPYCRSVNLFPGFTSLKAYTCRQCGRGVEVGRLAR